MGTLVEMESALPAQARKAADTVLSALREGLGRLQRPENSQHALAEAAMTAVAEALGLVRQIAESSQAAPGAPVAKTQLAATQLAPSPASAPGAARPAPGAAAPKAVAAKPSPAAPVARAAVAPAADEVPASALRAVEAALGAHSATNFYKGLAGGDIVASGGLFVATYQAPEVGEPLLLKVTMPGGYAFEAKGVVAWRRDVQTSSAAPGETPGFGAQFSEISDEGRGLIQRYVRNREPLFHDDA
jgi:Tfp pilus assembly protein PilZ